MGSCRKVVLFLAVMVAVWEATNGDGICGLKAKDLQACKPAVAAENPAYPTPECCSAVRKLEPGDIGCLCDYKNNKPYLLQLAGVDPARAMQLQTLCDCPNPVNC